jgi:hypothetical protein
MAELGITCPTSSAAGGVGSGVDIDKLSLIRTGEYFPANTSLDINAPGSGWASLGGPVFFSSTEFMEVTQVYRNGVLQLPAPNSSANNDVYFVTESGTIAFEYDVRNLDVIQVWNFTATSSG